jgi:hypothetical protein
MFRRITSVAAAAALALALLGGPVAAAPPGQSGSDVRIIGNAQLTSWGGVIDGTTVRLNVLVRCPVGSGTYLPFAGMPDAFGGQFPNPYLPGMTSPATYGGMVACTGRWERATTIARSVARNQDPSTHPFEYFSHGRTTFVVQLGLGPEPPVTTSRTVQVVVPRGHRR